jgi:hypothetical protein
MVWLEMGAIVLVLFYLAGRSPADMGYSLKFLLAKEFPFQYAQQWVGALPFFYLVVEALALVTLRSTGEWQILGALPFPKHAVTNYHLLRHSAKTIGLLLVATLPFWIGDLSLMKKLTRFFFALGILLLLQFAGFRQAYHLRNTDKKWLQRLLLWLPIETTIITVLVISNTIWHNLLIGSSGNTLVGLLAGWSLAVVALLYIRRTYEPGLIENLASREPKIIRTTKVFDKFGFKGEIISALIQRDLKFLWMRKRSAFAWLAGAAVMLLFSGLAQSSAAEAYASSIVIEVVFSIILINVLLILFEQDAQSFGVTRVLPVKAKTCWKSRWLLAAGFMAAPAVTVVFVIPLIFTIGVGYLFFVFLALLIPAIFAAMFCNAGFGLFPNQKFCGVLLNIALGLMILFWFYMPFGTIILLAISALWIRKSQRHFQLLEIT